MHFLSFQTSQLSRFHRVSHGFTAFSLSHGSFFISHGFTIFERNFSQTRSFLRNETQAAYSNAAGERIYSMINKNKTGSRSSLYLSWALLFIVLVKTHMGQNI